MRCLLSVKRKWLNYDERDEKGFILYPMGLEIDILKENLQISAYVL